MSKQLMHKENQKDMIKKNEVFDLQILNIKSKLREDIDFEHIEYIQCIQQQMQLFNDLFEGK